MGVPEGALEPGPYSWRRSMPPAPVRVRDAFLDGAVSIEHLGGRSPPGRRE
jgi:hypothetical protein